MRYKSTSHVLHFVLTFFTGGLWLIVWILCALNNSQSNKKAMIYSMQAAAQNAALPDHVKQAAYAEKQRKSQESTVDKIINFLF